ncbi:TPA: hypothetical protein JBD88_02725 [Legionella pneumophila subsp. pneumophila]|nr:Uncharacterised protein [Legionella pneumophila]HAT9353836.1 hypothetical protein [Legionella pneumophila subsp. pneumophila]CZR02159.1 Uncharacterised protein [Legionella pneumophila]GAN25003.1 hypothetical protein lptwr_02913 [Legionella pneumophila]HAT8700757.1 hypothetical protein [Legionella pneumophila]
MFYSLSKYNFVAVSFSLIHQENSVITLMLSIAPLFEGIQVICRYIDMVSSMHVAIMVERQYQGQLII